MAIIKIGAPLSGIRGTVGGITFSENGSGPYAKQWARPINPVSPNQSTQRSNFAQVPALWAALTAGQKTAWDTFAALPAQELTNSLGETYYASGYNWFVKCNTRLIRMGLSTISATPTQARPAAPTIDDFRVCVAGSESDLCSGGSPSASSSNPGSGPEKAFDNNTASGWAALAGTTTGWIRYDLPSSKNVKVYAIYGDSAFPTRLPDDWTFQVYTSGAWTTIHTVTNADLSLDQWYYFYCENPYTETDYRLNISANAGDATYLIVWEMQFFLGDEGASVICYPEDEFDSTPDWDLVAQVSIARGIGPQVKYPGFYEIQLNSAPGRWYQLIQTPLEEKFGTILDARSWYLRFYRQTAEGIRSAAATQRTETIGA
jgi:hypothetical protein